MSQKEREVDQGCHGYVVCMQSKREERRGFRPGAGIARKTWQEGHSQRPGALSASGNSPLIPSREWPGMEILII